MNQEPPLCIVPKGTYSPTAAALGGMIDPNLLAAIAFVHAKKSAGAGVHEVMRQPRQGLTLPAPDFVGFAFISIRHLRHRAKH
jgi:hypothetical protein